MEGQTLVTETPSWASTDRGFYVDKACDDDERKTKMKHSRSNSIESNRSSTNSVDRNRTPEGDDEEEESAAVGYHQAQRGRDTVIEIGYGNQLENEHQMYHHHGGVLQFAKVDNQLDNVHHVYSTHDLYATQNIADAASLTSLQPVGHPPSQNFASLLEYPSVLAPSFYDSQPQYYHQSNVAGGWQTATGQYPMTGYYPAPPPVTSPQYGRSWTTYYESPAGLINYSPATLTGNMAQDASAPISGHASLLGISL